MKSHPAMKQQMIDNELIDRCRSGQRAAQHEIYARTVERVYRLVLRISGNREDALDLVQDAYIRAFQNVRQFDGRSSFETWLSRIAINQALQSRRRLALEKRSKAAMNGRNLSPASVPPNDQKLDIDEALAQLPETDRTMLLLRYQEGWDYATLAAVTGCRPGTIASRLNRARQRVRELLRKSDAREERPRAVHPITGSNQGPASTASDVLSSRLPHGAEP